MPAIETAGHLQYGFRMVVSLLKRLLSAVVLVSFLAGTIAEATPVMMAAALPCTMMGMAAEGGANGPCPPDDKGRATCIPLIGCALGLVGLPACDVQHEVSFGWSPTWFPGSATTIAGRLIEPDIFPPIARG